MGGSSQAQDFENSGQGNLGQGFNTNQGNLGQGFDQGNQGNMGRGFDNSGSTGGELALSSTLVHFMSSRHFSFST